VVGRTFAESKPSWPPLDQAPSGAPNVVIVLLDDVGYAQFGCYGSDIKTPTFDGLFANGLRYSNYHTTALCSPTRACLMTGRNHHASGMARVIEVAAGFPGYDAHIQPENGFLSEILVRNGYATFALGKWHLAPGAEMTLGSPRTRWPLSKGFERFYGFLAGETDQYHPDLIADNHQVNPPKTPEQGYHLTEDLADRAIGFIHDLRAYRSDKPFLMYFAPGACHAPHQAPASFIEPYRGAFDLGWDAWRDQVFERQISSGLIPPGTKLSERPHWVPAWEGLSADERRLYARMMEVYAGFLTHTDAQVGRVLDTIRSYGELDNTIVLVMSDNGASAEGGQRGSFNEQFFFNFQPESLEENLARIDDLGGPHANNHYPWGWAWAGNTPLKRFKRDTHEGGVCDPLVIHWPARIASSGETRHQYAHVTDITPTLLDLIGITPPPSINGVQQSPHSGVSLAPTLHDAQQPSAHTTQYYEMLGSRAIYHDGWKAVAFRPPVMLRYDRTPEPPTFDDDVWELYHVAADFSECNDVAAEHPDKLHELQELWWHEAERNQVLPVNNQPGRFGDRRLRRDRYVFRPGISSIPEQVAPNLKNRAYTIAAELSVSGDGEPIDGIIVGHGGHSGGYALYVHERKLRFVYNFLGFEHTIVSADSELPPGDHLVRCSFRPTGPFRGTIELRYADTPVGSGHILRMTPITYGVDPFCVGYQRMTPIAPHLTGRFEIPAGVVRRVVIEAVGEPDRNPVAADRAALAQQ
jgi:arylsulfatase A-like enzyme